MGRPKKIEVEEREKLENLESSENLDEEEDLEDEEPQEGEEVTESEDIEEELEEEAPKKKMGRPKKEVTPVEQEVQPEMSIEEYEQWLKDESLRITKEIEAIKKQQRDDAFLAIAPEALKKVQDELISITKRLDSLEENFKVLIKS